MGFRCPLFLPPQQGIPLQYSIGHSAINAGLPTEIKKEKLTKKATNFSYKEAVMATKRKKMENCTPEVEDLFGRIFKVDGEKRIKFSEIRQHPIFISHFPSRD